MARAGEALTIVLGFDGSDAARRGVAHVGQVAAPAHKVVVVAVVPEVPATTMTHEPLVGGDFDAERLLREATELLAGTDSTTVETGRPPVIRPPCWSRSHVRWTRTC